MVRKARDPAALRAEVLRRLPFQAEVMVCRGGDLMALASRAALPDAGGGKDLRAFVGVLERRPRKVPALPLLEPEGEGWQVKVTAVTGRFALSLWRREGKRFLYPNEVVEKRLGVAATTRSWSTILAIRDILEGGGKGARSRGSR